MLVVVATLAMATGTASAQTSPTSPDGFLGDNYAHSDCVITSNVVPSEEQRQAWWQKVVNWVNPFNDIGSPAPGALYLVLQCAFSPQAKAEMGTLGQYIKKISVAFVDPDGGYYLDVLTCKSEDHGGTDWFPSLSGAEVKLGCTPAWSSGTSLASLTASTEQFACPVGVEIEVGASKFIRSYIHHGTNVSSNAGGSMRTPIQYSPPSWSPDCMSAGYYVGGVVPPDWPAGDPSPWADVGGCRGLTIGSADETESFFEDGDTVDMTLIPVDPSRPPGPVDVKIRNSEARPRGEPIRWEATARWPGEPDFQFIVGADTDQFDWVFLLECSDGTSKYVFYDPTGTGGNRRVDDGDGGSDLEECLSEAPDVEIAPSSWVPGLVARLQCVAEWTVTPNKPMDWHAGRLDAAMESSGVGDVVDVATAVPRTMGSMAESSSEPTSLNFGDHVVPLPAVPTPIGTKVRLGLGILVLLWAVRQSWRWWSGATNSKIAPE